MTYAYDAVGNRTSMSDSTGTTTYTHNANIQMTQEASAAGSKTYAWDKSGSQLSAGTHQYEYASLDGLTAATVMVGCTARGQTTPCRYGGIPWLRMGPSFMKETG